MKTRRLISTTIVMMLALSWTNPPAKAQQPVSGSTNAPSFADAPGRVNVSTLIGRLLRGRPSGFSLMPSNRLAGGNTVSSPAAAASSAVHGDGTVGRISMWVGTHPSGSSTLGDSIITQLNGNIGIGLATPMSKLSVQGMIETTLGGYKFPDGTVQTTAAVSGLQSVAHDSTLAGDGTSGSPLGIAVPLQLSGSLFSNPVLSVTNTAVGGGVGIQGQIDDGAGVAGLSVNSIGVLGASRNWNGVEGFTRSSDPLRGGVSGFCQNCNGLIGQGKIGVRGLAVESDEGAGVSGTGLIGVQGEGTSNFSQAGGSGVEAKGGNSINNVGGSGVVASGGEFNGRGVVATGGRGSVGYGVEATGGSSTGSGSTAGAGVFAKGGPSSGSNSQSGFGIIATAGDATDGATRGRAGAFEGDVTVSEHLTVFGDLDVQGTKNFKIDHPLDPENKYLLHASVESSEVLNIYSGNIITDLKGEAVVTLPAWFEALNRDLRYQLTVIGAFAQAIVAREVRDNQFIIKTNAPNIKVSWQVIGVRSDRAILKQPFKAVEDKPERERGHYLQPELYDQPEERGVEWARNPEMMRKLKQQRPETQQTPKQSKQIGRLLP